MVFPLFEGNKKGAAAPDADQERMIEGLNKEPADGADAELVALGAGELIAITEVHEECAVGGALR
ncbi:hypothetical protein D3C80_1703680 [compost metagenome]